MRLLLLILCVFLLAPAYAQVEEEDNGVLWEETRIQAAEKREPGFFKRPDKKNPASQLNYAKKLLEKGKTRKARRALLRLTHQWPDSDEAPKAQYEYAKLLMQSGAYMQAFKEFQYLIKHYPGEFPYNKTLDYQFKIANQVRTERWGDILFLPGFSTAERSLPLYRQIAKNGPNWEKTPQIWFYIGSVYEQTQEYAKAIDAYERIIYRTEGDNVTQRAAYRRLHCFYAMVKRRPRDENIYQRAISSHFRFLEKYPDHEKADHARKMLSGLKQELEDMHYRQAVFYDRNTDKVKAALISYRDFLKNFPKSKRAPQIKARIEELSAIANQEDKEQ